MSQRNRISLSQSAALADQISVVLDKQRRNSIRKNAAHEPLGPTPERAAKEPEGMVKIVPPIDSGQQRTNVRTYVAQGPVERYRGVLDADELAAATQAVTDILTAESGGGRVTSSYGEGGASVPGARHGGVADYVRAKACVVAEMRATLDNRYMRIIDGLLVGNVVHQDGRPLSLADLGRTLSPWAPGKNGENDAKVAFGAFRMCLVRLVEFYQSQRLRGHQLEPPSPESVKRMLTAGAARLQRMREQAAKKDR